MFDSVTHVGLASALDGLAARQQAIAHNVANVNTPGYLAKRVMFEDALAKSISAGSGRVTPTEHYSLEPTKLNGNNVNLETETLSNIDTVLRFQFASQAIDGVFRSTRAAMRTS